MRLRRSRRLPVFFRGLSRPVPGLSAQDIRRASFDAGPQFLSPRRGNHMNRTNGHRYAFRPCLEALQPRLTPAFSAVFVPAAHVLSITGTAFPEIGVISRDPAGQILLDNIPTGAIVSDTDTILINSGGSQDFLQIDMANGLFAPGF